MDGGLDFGPVETFFSFFFLLGIPLLLVSGHVCTTIPPPALRAPDHAWSLTGDALAFVMMSYTP